MGVHQSAGTDPGITTEVALVVTYFLGALAMSEPEMAGGLGVAVALLLFSRERMHRFVRDIMTEDELHDLLLFAASAVIVLPLMEDENIGPWDSINTFEIWRLVVLVMGVSGAGASLARRAAFVPQSRARLGIRLKCGDDRFDGEHCQVAPGFLLPAVAGAVLSTVATIIQMALVLSSSSRDLLRELTRRWSSEVAPPQALRH